MAVGITMLNLEVRGVYTAKRSMMIVHRDVMVSAHTLKGVIRSCL